MRYRKITKCRICGSRNIETILNLGKHPLANNLKKQQFKREDTFPLTLAFCRNCSLVQIKETVKKELLFKRYLWITGTSRTACDFADDFFKKTVKLSKPKKGDLIIEIASNDGTFLRPFLNNGFSILGIDPAENIAKLANKTGIRTLPLFWNTSTAQKVKSRFGKAKLIFARNVIAHASELTDFVAGINQILAEKGVGAVEFHYAGAILRDLQYDSIYHEHLCYFSIKTAERLLNKFGLHVFHIEKSPISGGAYILYFTKHPRSKTSNYNKLRQLENKLRINLAFSWKKFAMRCIKHRDYSRILASSFNNKKIIGFGSSARSSTYINFCGFNRMNIPAIIDNNRLKQGLFSAGSLIPIVSRKYGLRLNPDILFILAWNFKNEIIKECRKDGYKGKFLIPFPKKPYII